jgi:hypothetical protein
LTELLAAVGLVVFLIAQEFFRKRNFVAPLSKWSTTAEQSVDGLPVFVPGIIQIIQLKVPGTHVGVVANILT